MQAGSLVKYASPMSQAEKDARFILIELRGDRALIQLVTDGWLRPTEVVAITDLAVASY